MEVAGMTLKVLSCSLCRKGIFDNGKRLLRTAKIRHMSKTNVLTNMSYCADLVRKHDYEAYLCTRLWPPSAQPVSFAVNAFNVETAQIGDMNFSSDVKTGLVRMQFWKDSIQNIFKGQPPHTPTALALYQCVLKKKISQDYLERIINARYRQLNEDFYRSIADIEKYAEDTKSSLLYIVLEAEGFEEKQIHDVAGHIGKSYGLVTLLRSLPYNTSKGRIYLPRESLMKSKVSGEDIIRGRKQAEVCDIIKEISTVAKQHLEKARSMKRDVPSTVVPFFLYTVICDNYLKQLKKVNYNVFHSSLQHKNGLLPSQLLWQKIRRIY